MEEKEFCIRCSRSEDEVKLLDGVEDNNLVKICEECASFDNIPIMRRLNSQQIDNMQKAASVRQRLTRMASNNAINKTPKISEIMAAKKPIVRKDFNLSTLRKNTKPINLVDNYNWIITAGRKDKKISRKQLADAIGVSEEVIKMIENKELPDDALRIITKIEQYLRVRINKDAKTEEIIVLDEIKKKLENEQKIMEGIIEEEKELELDIEKIEENIEKEINKEKEEIVKNLKEQNKVKFDPKTAKNLTIQDLVRIKKEKESS